VSSVGGLHYGRFTTGGRHEWLLRIGAAQGIPVLLVPPLLEEMNRTRAFLVSLMRSLAARGFGCWLPDLPGTGESELALEETGWEDWQQAVRDAAAHAGSAAGRPPLVASLRGGALLDGVGDAPVWRFAPAMGASLARDFVRAGMLKPEDLAGPVIDAAGYRLPSGLFGSMRDAEPAASADLRIVRLTSDPAEADVKVEGPALWRRSEPANAPDLANALADDLHTWCERCAVF
jgi:alpha-beta hydrolase superfamily lysophospholipase